MQTETVRESIRAELLHYDKVYDIDDFIARAQDLKARGYLKIEIENDEHFCAIYGTRVKTETEKQNELKAKAVVAERWKEQRRKQYLELHQEFGV